MCDGCGWGEPVQNAAKYGYLLCATNHIRRSATIMFLEYIKQHQHLITRTDDAATLILRAFNACHRSIIWVISILQT